MLNSDQPSRSLGTLLPSEILFFIATFLQETGDDGNKLVNKLDWLSFMNTNKFVFREYKRRTSILQLNKLASAQYLISADFRLRISEAIAEPTKQVQLNLDVDTVRKLCDQSNYDLKNVQRIKADDFPLLNKLENIEEIILFNSSFIDLSSLTTVKTFHYTTNPSFSMKPLDMNIFQFGTLEDIFINTKIVNNYDIIPQLNPKLKKVTIHNCESIYDVSCFANIPFIELKSCDFVGDISSLCNCKEVSLISCRNITDVSALAKIQKLQLVQCDKVNDISALGCVEELILYRWMGNDVSNLTKVKKLELTLSAVADISSLLEVEELTLALCPNIPHIFPFLPKLKSLDISNCPHVSDFSQLPSLTSLTMTGPFASLKLVEEQILQLRYLTIGKVGNSGIALSMIENAVRNGQLRGLHLHSSNLIIKDFSSLDNLRTLKIVDDNVLTELPTLSKLLKLDLTECRRIRSIQSMPMLESLCIDSCKRLHEISFSTSFSSSAIVPLSCELYHCSSLQQLNIRRPISCMLICGNVEGITIYNRDFIRYLYIETN